MLTHIHTAYVPLLLNLKTMGISLDYDECGALIVSFFVRPTLVDQIRGKQMQDEELSKKCIRSGMARLVRVSVLLKMQC